MAAPGGRPPEPTDSDCTDSTQPHCAQAFWVPYTPLSEAAPGDGGRGAWCGGPCRGSAKDSGGGPDGRAPARAGTRGGVGCRSGGVKAAALADTGGAGEADWAALVGAAGVLNSAGRGLEGGDGQQSS